ncbi:MULTISPECIES: MFS transporter [unclassified Bacillus (in: firmicutes)]|uniref:MFS transporter n=1 Tax=unclassified Bacillus (in: firmicutes) TaxID=185979 RepID=UPI0008F1D3ED|nr:MULTISPECIES: MFS transporter [unclassified Bacillus (in: firmicutes)]SFA80857.1 MFS-type transporter involved in bile tolerance, Atg22 family [Bacillus sp. UNCCL13]SFQ70997.1 MFS-type transporter involved in bile tolerance, Atg22 family [Bacillus sp. cl95]
MANLYSDKRFFFILAANILSSIGSGITMIAIPWLLVSEVDGGKIFGYITIAMTAVNFVLTPMIGHIVDRYSRKNILLVGESLGFILITIFSIYGLMGFEYQIWHYLILFGTGSFYYNLFYPAIFAFNQEIFDKSVYRSLNGAMEIQGQLSSVLAGALAAVLLTKVGLEWLLLIDALTYLAAFLFFKAIPYVQKPLSNQGEAFLMKLTEGYRFMKVRPALFFFLLASFMPFIGVMVTNYVFPVYLAEVLKAEAAVYGMQTTIYGVGAVIAGILIPVISLKWGNRYTILFTVFLYATAISTIVLTSSISVYFLLTVLLAFGNAGTRVARNAFMMDVIPNAIMGRVDSLFRVVGLGIRLLLLTIFTQLSSQDHISYSFYLLSAVLIAAFLTVLFSSRKFVETDTHTLLKTRTS